MARSITFPSPGIILATSRAALSASLTVCLAQLASLGFSGGHLRVGPIDLDAGGDLNLRALLTAIGVVGGLLGVAATAQSLGNLLYLFAGRVGLLPQRTSVGAFRLIEVEFGRWGLELDLSASTPSPKLRIVRGAGRPDDRGAGASGPSTSLARVVTSRNGGSALGTPLWFPLDEGAAGELSRLFHPGEPLLIHWLNLPAAAGGPVLLSIAAHAEEAAASAVANHDLDSASPEARAA